MLANDPIQETDLAVVAALKRSSTDWDLSLEGISTKLRGYEPQQIDGLINNVKGILHEMEFQILENNDGDTVVASMFPDTNHQGVDLQLLDLATGESWDIQLKATQNQSLVQAWIQSNPDTEILVTEEIAQQMNLQSSGFSNEELTVRVEDFVDTMLSNENTLSTSLWESFALLPLLSAGVIIFELWRRYRKKEISDDQFCDLTIKTLGIKIAKFASLLIALSVPGLNVIVGTYLLASFILSSAGLINEALRFQPFKWIET